MSVNIGRVSTLPSANKCDKAQAIKVLEESAELFAAVQKFESYAKYEGSFQNEVTRAILDKYRTDIIDEASDLITALCGLLTGVCVVDMRGALDRCVKKNMERGYYEHK